MAWLWWFGLVWFVVFYATFINLSIIPWQSVLLVEETGVPREIHQLYHIMLYPSPWSRFELTTLVVIGTDCIGSCKSNYHMITAMTLKQEFITWTFLSEMKGFPQSADSLVIFSKPAIIIIMNDLGGIVKGVSFLLSVITHLCLNFFHLLARKPNFWTIFYLFKQIL